MIQNYANPNVNQNSGSICS